MLLTPADRQFLTFFLDDNLYGISVDYIKEVNNLAHITPGESCVHLRGKILPLVDLRVKFQLPERLFPAANSLLIIAIQGESFAVLVDGIDSVLRLDPSHIQDDSSFPYLEGRATYFKQSIKLINIMACLNFTAPSRHEKAVLTTAS